MEYDQSGKIISRTWADGKIWSYTYLEKVNIRENKLVMSFWMRILKVALITHLGEDLQEKSVCSGFSALSK